MGNLLVLRIAVFWDETNTMEQEKLRKMIKAMYLLKDILAKKSDDDRAFKLSAKSKIIQEIQEIINLGLEEFYALRAN